MESETAPEERVSGMLRNRGETVGVAESCTGGLVGSKLTDIPGSSDYFDRSVVSYSYDSKLQELCVDRETLDEHGAVSEPIAAQMTQGIRDSASVDWGVGTTGIAGPSGGTEKTPVGTVYIGIAYAAEWGSEESFTKVEHHVFNGDRTTIKDKIATKALTSLCEAINSLD